MIIVIYLIVIAVVVAGMWKAFEKAGEPGWAAIVPFYNIYIMTKIAGVPAWWMIGFFIPIVSIIVAILISLKIAENFGKSAGFGIGLALLGFVFWPMLGFGDAQYRGGDFSGVDQVFS